MLTTLIELSIISYADYAGGTPCQWIVTGLLFLIPAMAVAIHAVNWFATHTIAPRTWPRLDFQDGIPTEFRTMVVVPCLATHVNEIESLLHQLELHFLGNVDPHLHFALLTDFADAPKEQMPEDQTLLEHLKLGVQKLNQKYAQGSSGPFFLFHRERKWNPAEGCWMGWERKRGKLVEFNRLLTGSGETSYAVQMGDLGILKEIKYVITVDADTVMTRGSARRLIATLAHPLNKAVLDPERRDIVAGYTVLQPRVEIKPTSATQSLFTQIFSGDIALDLYTRAVSDVYQDLFGEGNYTGKGIYDVAAFENCLAGRAPENALLSHDLFEGLHGRVGLVSDVVVFEEYPPHYLSNARRWHRWVRGDWQLLPWLLPRVPGGDGKRQNNPFSGLDRWKIIDNLRRSLMMPVILACLIMGWLWLPGLALLWTLLSITLLAIPLTTGTITNMAQRLVKNIADDWFQVGRGMLRWLLTLTFLPYQALITLDAIGTVLVRMLLTRKRLLQWTTSAHTLRLFGKEMKVSLLWKQMIGTSVFAVCIALLVGWTNPSALPVAGVFLLAWLAAPQIAFWISRPIVHRPAPITLDQQGQLRCLARRTWLYFEHFVGPDDHWLPPDHFQEEPRGLVAHRTSPTNIGLLLLSTLAAYDLGYIGLMDLILRLGNTLGEMEKLQRYRGHFLNWYDTRNLNQLSPPYVSTVDSGNLAGCLLALKQGCIALSQDSLLRWPRWQGLLDTLLILEQKIEGLQGDGTKSDIMPLKAYLVNMRQQVLAAQYSPTEWATLLDDYCQSWEDFLQLLLTFLDTGHPDLDVATLQELRVWEERVNHHLKEAQRESSLLVPWLSPLSQPPTILTQTALDPALAEVWQTLQETLPITLQLGQVPAAYRKCQKLLEQLQGLLEDQEALDWCASLAKALDSARMSAQALLIGCQALSDQIESLFRGMDFRFLFDPQRQVFHLGYNVSVEKVDSNHYDLLASEARLASLVAIARGDVPQSHWLHLARPMTQVNGSRAIISWNGSMFEYLMPCLLIRSYHGTSLSQTHQTVVQRQIAYGRQKNVPWGISEAGYCGFDAHMNYQYRGFGVPGLGFKRGLSEDLVISPYASLLALSIQPQAVMKNITDLERFDLLELYGFYESIDFTESHLSLDQEYGIVRSYYAHHQGMILLALANYLQDETMITRFHADHRVESVELLLQERIPRQAPLETPHPREMGLLSPSKPHKATSAWHVPVDTPLPQVHCLSNGSYCTLITNAGGGFSTWKETALTRWYPDSTLDNWGTWVYVQDLESDAYWSASFQPVASHPETQEVLFFPHKAEFQRRDHGISLRLEVTVAPDDDVEIRRITLTNHSKRSRYLRVTSYGEVVLSPQSADHRHPAYNKLFVESEFRPELNALLFRRRLRSADEQPIFLMHLLVAGPGVEEVCRYETIRNHFIGRGGTLRSPAVINDRTGLTGFVGAPLDPIMSISNEIHLEPLIKAQDVYFSFSKPRMRARVALITLAAESRQQALALAQRYQDWHRVEGVFDQARFSSERELNQQNLTTREIMFFQQLLSSLLYPYAALRADPATLAANRRGQEGLWPFTISGDYPILVVRVDNQEDIALVSDLLRAHAYWRKRRIKIDLVILNLQDTGYSQELHNRLYQLLNRRGDDVWLNRRGGIFVLRADQMTETQRVLLETAARVILNANQGELMNQLRVLQRQPTRLPSFTATFAPPGDEQLVPPLERPKNLIFDNALGGFSPDGREYVIYLEPGKQTPKPWINVIANPEFGFTSSDGGLGYTWALNSGENRLTPWHNDPVTDTPGEALYLREEEVGHYWSPTPLPTREEAPYIIRHGNGYSVFEHNSHGLKQRLKCFAAPDAPVKMVQVRLQNTWQRTRRVTVTYYAEWVLGTAREATATYLIPDFDTQCHTLLVRNPYNTIFGQRIAFLTATREPYGLTTDRTEFLGRMGCYRHPAALSRVGLSGHIGPGLDPCAAMQILLWLAPGETKEVTFILGQGADREEALLLAQRYQKIRNIEIAWQTLNHQWDHLLNNVRVKTPDKAMNLLLNRWLLYQTLSCRMWGRSALYQSSGAYGFRDQLQDGMALVNAAPEIVRSHILDAASRQFKEGDVLHWWHPPTGRGVRTRCSDDLLWLPYVSAHYVKSTGDIAILSEEIPFLKGEPLQEGEAECYGQYGASTEAATLHEHCRRALERGNTAGGHGLPLIGSHDWNDGFNRVGIRGRGESVWLGWFLYTALTDYAEICALIGNREQATNYRQQAEDLRLRLATHTWDGAWYRRAYDDDGIPLGAKDNQECQIDSLAQSWAVLSGAGDPSETEQAMESVAERLVRPSDQLILLFTPPLDKTKRDPGYVKGYLPGIRENGGQYTHAALWAVWAFAKLGQGDRAAALFRMLNPIYHADTPAKVSRYRVEPYVVAADVYSVPPHTGHGGWTWYTGSAAWMYRLGLEAILGLRRMGKTLQINPCIPADWKEYELTYQYGDTSYHIRVKNPDGVNQGVKQILSNGKNLPQKEIPLLDDGKEHRVIILMG
jgi:cyclic beta-1,2-glucan synthetase